MLSSADEAQLLNDETFFNELSDWINELITSNFEQLVALLYRIDVNEKKLKNLLAQSSTLSSDVIARLLIERQLEKLISRRNTKKTTEENNDLEKW